MAVRADSLFAWIARRQGTNPWGDVLDAGTGAHSLSWLATLPTRSITAVTVEDWRTAGLREAAPSAALAFGQWTDPAFLFGESFDTVLIDYVIGALDGHAPYFQYDFLARIRPHCRGRVYLVGLEPPPRDGSVLDEVCRIRDACILLAGHRMYREYPCDLVSRWMTAAGFVVEDVVAMPNVVGARFVNGQLDVATRKLSSFRDEKMAAEMAVHIEETRARALAMGEVRWGADYVIAAR